MWIKLPVNGWRAPATSRSAARAEMNNELEKIGTKTKHGGRRVGSGRKRGSPNKVTKDIREALAPYSPAAQATLVELLGSDDVKVALAAANSILDRVHGKASATIEAKAANGGKVIIEFTC